VSLHGIYIFINIKGSEFAWYIYSSILSSVLGITRYARLWEDDETIMTTGFS